MHARELLSLASVITWHGPVLVEHSGPLPAKAVENYWTASKCRLDRWGNELRILRDNFVKSYGFDAPSWKSMNALCDEILTSEIVTRVWTAIIGLHDQHHNELESEPIVRSVMLGHMEARHRVMTLILNYHGVGPHESVVLNRLRYRCERWSDTLLARMAICGDVTKYAHDSSRVHDFAEDWPKTSRFDTLTRTRAGILLASFSAAFGDRPSATENTDLNAKIAESILLCFPADVFTDTGTTRSLWESRLRNYSADAQKMIDELVQVEMPQRNILPFMMSERFRNSNN